MNTFLRNVLFLCPLMAYGMEEELRDIVQPQEQMINFVYGKETLQIPKELVELSGTLKNYLTEFNQQAIVHFDSIENLPFKTLQDLQDVFDIAAGKGVEVKFKKYASGFLQLIEWLDFSDVWKIGSDSWLKPSENNFRKEYECFESFFKNYLAYNIEDECDDVTIKKFARELGVHIFDGKFGCRCSHEGIELCTDNTHWGIHLPLKPETREAIEGFYYTIKRNKTNVVNLKYLMAVFPNLQALHMLNEEDFRSFWQVCHALHEVPRIKTLKCLKLDGVYFYEPFIVAKLLEADSCLEELFIEGAGAQQRESSCVQTELILSNNNTTLKKLALRSLQLSCVPACIKNLKALEELDLSNNVIKQIKGSELSKNLELCDLTKNPIKKVEKDKVLPSCVLKDVAGCSSDINVKVAFLKVFAATRMEDFV